MTSIGIVALASVLTLAFKPLFDGKAPMTFFVAGVILAASVGGVRLGLLTTTLSMVVASAAFAQATFIFAFRQSTLVLFGIISVLISIVVGKLRRANQELKHAQEALRLTNEALRQRTEALASANAELEQFATTVAHDLATPLRNISGLTDLLLHHNRERLDEQSRNLAGMIVTSAKRLHEMINGLIVYAAAIRDDHPINATTDANQVMTRVLADLHHQINTSDATIQVDKLPVFEVEEAHLVQIFSNLIGNSLKYSAAKPEIRISSMERTDDWLLSVSDNGIGFDMRDSKQIFRMFHRLDREHGDGAGIGLALVQRIVHRYGGEIWAESVPGSGATFFFTLPRSRATELIAKSTPSNANRSLTGL